MEISEYFRKISEDLATLAQDVKRIADKKKEELKSGASKVETPSQKKESFKRIPLRSLQPTVVLRKNKEEAKQAEEDPESTFITDQLNKILDQ